MQKLKLTSPAKINLCLDILKKTPSGYHEISTVIHEIPQIADEITIEPSNEQSTTSIVNADKNSPIQMEDNLAHKALLLIKRLYKIDTNYKIQIHKNIPLASGLGGASSNAATVLKAINELEKLSLSPEKLESLAAQLGMDVPFFIRGGTQLATHYGENLHPLPSVKITLEIHTPTISKLSTAHQYAALNLKKCGLQTEKTTQLIKAIKTQKPIKPYIHNDFSQLYKIPQGHHLSGSGPALFKILHDH